MFISWKKILLFIELRQFIYFGLWYRINTHLWNCVQALTFLLFQFSLFSTSKSTHFFSQLNKNVKCLIISHFCTYLHIKCIKALNLLCIREYCIRGQSRLTLYHPFMRLAWLVCFNLIEAIWFIKRHTCWIIQLEHTITWFQIKVKTIWASCIYKFIQENYIICAILLLS